MQIMKKPNHWLAALFTLVLAGCAAAPSGDKFTAVVQPPQGKGLVYVYRPNMMYGKLTTFEVRLDGEKVADIGNQAFFKIPVAPGSHTVVTEHQGIDDPITVSVAAGETRFLRMAVRKNDPMGFVQSLYFTEVIPQLAAPELLEMTEETKRYYGAKE